MSEVFVCPEGTLTPRSVRDLRKAGVVVVEAREPERCQFIRSTELVKTDDLLWASLSALNVVGEYGSKGNLQRESFTKRLFEIVDETRKSARASQSSDEADGPLAE